MPITPRLLQKRLTQVGVIRLGETRISQRGKPYPAKLETFRITSPSEQLVRSVAELLGGEVKPWQNKTGPEWEVITRATEIAVRVPPQHIDPNFELWGNGFRARMCDGDVERIRQLPCLCEAAARARYEERGVAFPEDGRFERDPRNDCKPTTRLSLMIDDVPAGIGTFKLESHGWNAASELPMLAEAIATASTPIPAILRLEQRESGRLVIENGKERVDPRKYAVPVLDFFGLFTPRQAFSGQIGSAVQAAIGAEQRQALTAAEAPVDWLAEIAAAQSATDLNGLKDRMVAAGVRDQQVVEAWKARGAAIVAAAEQPADAAPEPPSVVAEVVEGEAEPDPDQTWAAILREVGPKGWKTSQVEAAYRERMGHDPSEANGWQLASFLQALRGGQVAN